MQNVVKRCHFIKIMRNVTAFLKKKQSEVLPCKRVGAMSTFSVCHEIPGSCLRRDSDAAHSPQGFMLANLTLTHRVNHKTGSPALQSAPAQPEGLSAA